MKIRHLFALLVAPPVFAGSDPIITSSNATSAIVGTAFKFEVCGNSGTWYYTATGLPPGLTINDGSGWITGIPTEAGKYVVPITIRNDTGITDGTLTITVSGGSVPVITSIVSDTTTVGAPYYRYVITATNEPTGYGFTNVKWPPGLYFLSEIGVLGGQPLTAGTYAIKFYASNQFGVSPATEFTLTINP